MEQDNIIKDPNKIFNDIFEDESILRTEHVGNVSSNRKLYICVAS